MHFAKVELNNEVVILAGGFGTQFEETGEKPKPMIEIGGKPILARRHYSNLVTDYIICPGIKIILLKVFSIISYITRT